MGTEAQQRNAVGDCCIHHLSSLCDPSGEECEGAETIPWPLKADLGLLHHSIYLQKRQWDKCLICPEVNSQEFLLSAQTEQMTSFHSFQGSATTCSNVPSEGCTRSVCSPWLCCHTFTLPFTFLQATSLPVPYASPTAHLGMWTQNCAVISSRPSARPCLSLSRMPFS